MPGRQVEGFLDVAHFAWIHTDTFADPDNQQVPDYTPQETPFGFVADYWSSVGNYPASSDFRAPEGFQWLRHFEMHLPFTATLTIHFPADARLVIMNAASPVSSRVTRMFAPIARNFDLHVPVEDVHAFNLRVFEEDRPDGRDPASGTVAAGSGPWRRIFRQTAALSPTGAG
ncbi:Vanillate O-demethylase oxygenase subunit [Klebsiella pneumoniae]|uniref:Vanillate O-demethylase oxygenase subunit n=1 Tax=Klebsiella pneumoniae TaxID=573 RepID=A0A377WI12_KLEPN|nr:Vanillate O-demethylase oxygenase subunit [Klebsiella pneumoniae]